MNGSGMPVMGITPSDHADVDQHLEQQHGRDAAGEGEAEDGLGAPADDQHAPDEAVKSRKHDHAAQEAQLLAQTREGEVGRLTGR